MKVLQLNSRRLFGQFNPGTPELVPQGLQVAAAATLTSWLPAIGLSLTMDSSMPLYAFIGRDVLAILIGILIYKQSSHYMVSCVPAHGNPPLPVEEIKKAA